jgi:hypothetical protein
VISLVQYPIYDTLHQYHNTKTNINTRPTINAQGKNISIMKISTLARNQRNEKPKKWSLDIMPSLWSSIVKTHQSENKVNQNWPQGRSMLPPANECKLCKTRLVD